MFGISVDVHDTIVEYFYSQTIYKMQKFNVDCDIDKTKSILIYV